MRYISDNVISFSILVEGCSNSARVSFTPRTSGGSTFYTDSEALIKALESSEMFNNVYRRAPECVKEQVGVKKRVAKAQEKPKVVAVESVSGWQDAIVPC